MRTHGWAGDPPASDEEAVARILDAARACLGGHARADLAAVADRLGVTRQTVYRYFPSRRALFAAVAAEAVDDLVGRMRAHLAGVADARDAVVEAMVLVLRELRDDPQLAFIARPEGGDVLVMTPDAPALTAGVLGALPIDLGHLDGEALGVLAEHMVRLLQSLLLDPATPGRDEADLRRFLHACLDHHLHPATIRS